VSVVEALLLVGAGAIAGYGLVRSIIVTRRQREREAKEWERRVERFLALEEAELERERRELAKEIVDELERRDP